MSGDASGHSRIVKWKWSLASGQCTPRFSWSVMHLGQDEHGIWLGARRSNPVVPADGHEEPQADDGVWLVPSGQFWIAAFWFSAVTDLTIDICQPVTQDGDGFSFVDLELDLFRNAEGEAGIVDEDEFGALAASRLVPEHDLTSAVDTAARLLPRVEQRTEPFGHAARPWLDRLR